MNLIDKINSILTGSRVSISAILSDATTLPFVPKFTERFRTSRISKTSPSTLQPVMPSDLSVPYSSMKNAVAEVVDGADTTTIEIDQLSRLVDGAVENIARRVDRSRFRLENIKEGIISENENPSVVFTETFDNTSMTDINETTAVIRDGGLRSDVTSTEQIHQSTPALSIINTASKVNVVSGSKITVTAVSPGIASSPIDGVGGAGAVMRTRHTFASSMKLNGITVLTNTKTNLARVYGIDGSGMSHELSDPEISRSSAGGTYVFHFNGMVLSAVDVVSYCQDAQVIDQATVKTILTGGTSTVEQNIIDQIKAAASSFKVSDTQYKAAYVYGLSVTTRGSYNSASDTAKGVLAWQSKPIRVEGDVKTLKLSSMQSTPAGTDVAWSVSINGSSFVDVCPVNISEITSERLVFESSGVARFRFPVKDGTTFSITEGKYEGSTVKDLISRFGNVERVVGAVVEGPRDPIGAVSYFPEIPDEIDLSHLGIAPDAPSVVDARTNGELGERFVSTAGRKIMLSHRPAVAPTVYVGGTLASLVSDTGADNPALDQSKYFYNWNGRELKFNREVTNVTVYYSYPVSTIVVRAKLTATPSANTGASVQSYSLALNHV